MFHKIAGLATAGALVIGAIVPAFATYGGGYTRPTIDRNINRATIDNYASSTSNTGNNQIVVGNQAEPQPTLRLGFGGGYFGSGGCGCIGDITMNTGDASARATALVNADLINQGEPDEEPMGMNLFWFGPRTSGSTYNLNEADILNTAMASANTGGNYISVETGGGGFGFQMPGAEAPSRDIRMTTGDADSQSSATVNLSLTGF